MVLGTKSAFISDLCVNDNIIERVHVFKLLGVLLDDNLKWDNNLKWNNHVDAVCAKASSRLHFLKILKRSFITSDDLLYFYTAFIRPILEYACAAWHNSLTNEQSRQIESVQKRALSIISEIVSESKVPNRSVVSEILTMPELPKSRGQPKTQSQLPNSS